MANTYLTMTQPSGGSRRKWTWSAWIKKSYNGANQSLCVAYQDSANWTSINFETSDQLNFYEFQGSSVVGQKKLSMVSRDTNGWYHFMIIWDSENTTADDRMIIYVNGVRQTAFSASTNPSVNTSTAMNRNNYPVRIGTNNSNNYFNGSMSHVNFCGGTVLAPTVFGETDATTGEWKIKANPTFTPGIGGYSILKDGNTITDQSANSNNFSLGGGTLTKTEDSPSNVFATWNYLSTVGWYKQAGYVDFYNGSTKIAEAGGNHKNTASTLGAFTGKYYFETKMGALNNSLQYSNYVGVITATDQAQIGDNYTHVGQTANSVGYNSYNGQVFTSDSGTNYGSALATGDILCVALDVTNKKVYFRKNADAWFNSGDPTSGSTGTGAVSLPTTGDAWLFGGSPVNSSIESNFGNGYFGQSAVSSAGSNASGNGIFEYDVPTGYTALSTKGLNL